MKLEVSIRYDNVVKDYIDGISVQEIADKYGYANKTAIFGVLKARNIPTKKDKWTKIQLSILKEEYPYQEWDTLIEKLIPFSKDRIIHKAYELNIKRENYYFTDEELNLLVSNYSLMSTQDLKDTYFPNKTISSLACKANKLGLVSREKWTESDTNFVLDNYSSMTNLEISKLLNRTIGSIAIFAYNNELEKTYSKMEFTKDYLIKSLQNYAFDLGRTPFSEELIFNENIPSGKTYSRYFGSYAIACQESGLEVNTSLFGNTTLSYFSKNNDVCLSKSEQIITNFFIDNNIKYNKEIYYKNIIDDVRCGMKRTDWVIGNNVIVEFFGMPEKEQYKIKMNEKIKICEDNNVKLISLYKKDLVRLDSIFPEYIKLAI